MLILYDLVYKRDKSYYPQALSEECKYTVKDKKMKRLTIEDESEGEDKSEHNFKVENKLENKFANLQIEFANFGFRQQISAYFWKICAKTLYSTLLLVDMTSVFKKEDVFLLKLKTSKCITCSI